MRASMRRLLAKLQHDECGEHEHETAGIEDDEAEDAAGHEAAAKPGANQLPENPRLAYQPDELLA